MTDTSKAEVTDTAVDAEVQQAETGVTILEAPQTVDQMDALIAVTKRLPEFGKAVDALVGAIIQRSYPGDWVCHPRPGVAEDDQVANMNAAAAERIALFLGISETNWIGPIKSKADDGHHYTYTTEADFSFGKRKIHVISKVGTRDKFFGKADGKWKELDEVQEDDIQKASFRACRKEGVRTLTGTRNIPLKKLRELGFDTSKVNIVGHTSKLTDADKKAKGSDGLIWKEIKVASVEVKKKSPDPKKPWILWNVSDGKVQYSMFADMNSDRLLKLQLHAEDQTPVKIGIKLGSYNGQEQYSIEKVEGEDVKGDAPKEGAK